MSTSDARIKANQANALKSTGPKTEEGKARSRQNGLKHGLTGQGIVLAEVDAAEVEARHQAFQSELTPKSAVGAVLVLQMATLSVRMERGAQQEFAAVAAKVRNAADDFDASRIAQAEELFDKLGENPRSVLRKLMRTPEGVELIDEEWRELLGDLIRPGKPSWVARNMVRAAWLMGIRDEDSRYSRVGVLSRATWGDFDGLADSEGGELNEDARKAWAREKLVELIEAEIADLAEHYEGLDHELIAQDRAEAGGRALFDPSKEACLARRYESEARRGFFKAMKQLGEVEVEHARQLASAPRPKYARPEPLGSSCAGPSIRPIMPTSPSPMASKPTPSPSETASEGTQNVETTDRTPSRSVPMPA